ncbi:hypothetical protein CVT24_007323 [Panaeolus cyanescens]|uniref:F-box domain-containing protein n=1 Tax=Panaeolus cyanescens TaxID=181874 RepID=A0A409W578_9AGAR|nr:hypothetical protein CVT24_007323 [Panaeolus cyanescens]
MDDAQQNSHDGITLKPGWNLAVGICESSLVTITASHLSQFFLVYQPMMSRPASVFADGSIFPAEILAEIVGQLADLFPNDPQGHRARRKEMKKLAVVSHTMCAIARTQIFDRIKLTPGDRFHQLANFFRNNPRIAAAVRHIDTGCLWDLKRTILENTLNNQDIVPFLELKHVKSLEAGHFTYREPDTNSTILCPQRVLDNYLAPRTGTSSLQSLSLGCLKEFDFNKILLLQSLESLYMNTCTFAPYKLSTSSPANTKLKLKSLRTYNTTIPFALLQSCPSLEDLKVFNKGVAFSQENVNMGSQAPGSLPLLPSLKRLEFDLWGDEDLNAPYDTQYPQFRFIMGHSPALEELSVKSSHVLGPSLSYLNHHQLRRLDVDWSPRRLQSAHQFLGEQIELLSSLQIPHLETLSLKFLIVVFISNSEDEEQLQQRIGDSARQLGQLIGDHDSARFPSLKSSAFVLDMFRFLRLHKGPMTTSCEDMKREMDTIINDLVGGGRFEFTSEVNVKDHA